MFANFTEETCTGTGATLALAGVTTGNIPFSESFADGDKVAYVVEDSGGTIKVAGIGAYVSSTDDITRDDTWNWNGTVIDENPTTNITLSGGTHTVRCDAYSDILRAGVGTVLPSGKYTQFSNQGFAESTAQAGGEFSAQVGEVVLMTGILVRPTWITEIAAYITTAAASSNVRFGIYHADPDGTPGALIVDSGDLDASSTGFVSNTLTNPILLPAGAYLIGNQGDSTTVRCQGLSAASASSDFNGGIQGTTASNRLEGCRYYTGTYGAMPATLGAENGEMSGRIYGMYYR